MAFDPLNSAALLFFLACWLLYPYLTRLITTKDLTTEMVRYRSEWLQQMLTREDRITDISLARGLFSSVMFLASTSILLISGLLGVLATASYIHGLVEASTLLAPTSLILFEIKIIFLILIQVHSFFKFTWSMRLHSYSMIIIGAAPGTQASNQVDGEAYDQAQQLIKRGARLSSLASQSYFSGLRGYYFGLAALTWFIGPVLLIFTTLITMGVLIRREHYSRALKAISL